MSQMLDDSQILAQWVEASSNLEGFWDQAPTWSPGVARRSVDGQLLVWGERGLILLSAAASVVAVHIDGQVTLEELAEDLAAAADASDADARSLVTSMAFDLVRWGSVEGVLVAENPDGSDERDEAAASPSTSGPGDAMEREASGSATQVEVQEIDGQRVTTEYLADGRRRVTTELTFSTGADADAATRAITEAVLSGARSPAELVPPNSCLGAKLRDGDHVPLLSFRGVDGKVRSVRCHHPEVATTLRALAGDCLVTTDERGPVEAFVVTPLEGDGPVRIYDGQGHRVGRPRSVDESVDVVDQLLGDRTGPPTDSAMSEALPLAAVLVHRGQEGILVPAETVNAPRAARALIEEGWFPTWASARVRADGSVTVPSGLGLTRPVVDQVSMFTVGGAAEHIGMLALTLGTESGSLPAGEALDRLVDLAEHIEQEAVPADGCWRGLS